MVQFCFEKKDLSAWRQHSKESEDSSDWTELDSQDSPAMSWWETNFWIILAVAMIIVSVGLGLILFCVCRWHFRQGKKWEIAKPLKQNKTEEEKMYENVHNESPVHLPPLPPRGLLSSEDSSPQETQSQPPATYSLISKVKNKQTVSIPSYIEPEDDYDDVEMPANTENRHFETTISSFWQAEDGSHSLF
ncbi:SLP adapter and CSK-interacting membrane protein isoform X1 [Microcebus murinus]|uniref:SLP adapter and CSK-interacting membrane protein isoform X1 n=1 Tax=Microcebus murinus TaxID=30608 RepID=UPI0006435BC5|nr:SLP adapter and CSK-interacting membrane protein isoform X5 [Microcebus murinus]